MNNNQHLRPFSLRGLARWDSSKHMFEESRICSREVEGCELASYLPPCPWDPELHYRMVTTAKTAFDFHKSLLVGEYEVQQNISLASLSLRSGRCHQYTPKASWVTYALLCCPSCLCQGGWVSHEGQYLQARGSFQLSIEGLIYLFIHSQVSPLPIFSLILTHVLSVGSTSIHTNLHTLQRFSHIKGSSTILFAACHLPRAFRPPLQHWKSWEPSHHMQFQQACSLSAAHEPLTMFIPHTVFVSIHELQSSTPTHFPGEGFGRISP